MEYHVDLDTVVDDNIHAQELKCYNTNCRIQVQHVGEGSYNAQNYLNPQPVGGGPIGPQQIVEEKFMKIRSNLGALYGPLKDKGWPWTLWG